MTYDSQPYLDHLGMAGRYAYEMTTCELCGSDEFELLRSEISIGKGKYGTLPVQICKKCGYLMQNPRFERNFYKQFYRQVYRLVIKQSALPSQEFIEDQIERGKNLLNFGAQIFGKAGAILDVGCSAGGMLIPFKEKGWRVYGMDPDTDYVRYGQEKLGLDIDHMDGEDMALGREQYDLVIIMGSLEHVYDPNLILRECRKASKPGGILLMEGRFTPLGHSRDYLNHNHHRYLRKDSMELLMWKHGWKPFLTTEKPICGPTRRGNGYVFGRTCAKPNMNCILNEASGRSSLKVSNILKEFGKIDLRSLA